MSLKTALLILGLISLLSYIASKIFLFFGIPTSTYLIYLLYAYALGIWNLALPSSSPDIFTTKNEDDE